MRAFIILIAFFYISCITPKKSSSKSNYITTINNEIATYGLSNIDTLVDIGCSRGFHDKDIAHFYPKLFFILEDLPFDLQNRSIAKAIKKVLKNCSYTPEIQENYKFIAGFEDSIPLESSKYKMVLCRKTLHEFSHKEKMAKELIRILAKGGILIIAEADPKFEGESDRFCKMKYLPKSEIIEIFKSLKLEEQTSFSVDENRLNVLKFRK